MRLITIITLLFLVMTIFLVPFINGAPVKAKRSVPSVANAAKVISSKQGTSPSKRSISNGAPSQKKIVKRAPSAPSSKRTANQPSQTSNTKKKREVLPKKRLNPWDWQ